MKRRNIILILVVCCIVGLSCSFGDSIRPTETATDPPEPSTPPPTATNTTIPSITPTPTIGATATIPETDLVAYFPFEGNAQDASGYENHATLYGPVLTTDRFGHPESAYFFDGVDDCMEIPDDNSLEFTGDFSIALWIKPLVPDDEEPSLIMSKFPPDGVPQVDAWWFGILWDRDNRLEFSTAPGYDDETISMQGVPVDSWTCVVFTYQASDQKWVFYLNGLKDNEGNNNRQQFGNTSDLTIGGYDKTHIVSLYHGSMDDLAIYQGTLSAEEALIYCQNNPRDINMPPPSPASSSTPEGQAGDCSQGWSRLSPGIQAIVTPGTLPNRLRSEPLVGDNILASLPPGTVVQVLQGPICSDQLVFWKVEAEIDGQTATGWTAEGDLSEYWLEPYTP